MTGVRALGDATPAYAYNNFHQTPDPPHQPLYLRSVLAYLQNDPRIVTVLDAGCGDGNFTASVPAAGYATYGLDMSESGIEIASSRGVGRFARGSIYENLTAAFPGMTSFDSIITIEVIEHLYSPREFVRRAFDALRPGGTRQAV